MSCLHNEMILEDIIDEVWKMPVSKIAHELGKPWAVAQIAKNKEQLVEELVMKRFEEMGGPHG